MVLTEERTTGAPLFTLGGSRQAASVGAQAWLIKHGDGHLGTDARSADGTRQSGLGSVLTRITYCAR